eukprot:scpid57824/ scgid15852/ Ankyrin repeat and sterile alpha motif domain-containing protein 1B
MGKKEEKQLLEAASKGDKERAERLLYPKQRKNSAAILQLERADIKDFRMKVSVAHINVDCCDSAGNTPLTLAVLNGHRDLAAYFIMHSCDINARDSQGNTAMHFAAFHYRLELVEVLIKAGAPVDEANMEGNRPIHFAVQHFQQGKPYVLVKLLQSGANGQLKNNQGDTPLLLAARLDKKEAVQLLVDAVPELSKDVRPLIEASRTGRLEICRVLLDNCVDPNGMDDATGMRPLQEAVRFHRFKIAELLVSFGADSKIANRQQETGVSLANELPGGKGQDFLKMFEDYKDKDLVRPQAEIEREKAKEIKQEVVPLREYPLLKSRINWTHNHPEYRSRSSDKHPNTNLLDSDKSSLYIIPGGNYNWVVFDFGSVFTLTGMRLWTWHSHQCPKNVQIHVGNTLSGPWIMVKSFKCDMEGSSDPTDPGTAQDFKGFYDTSQYWKIVFVDNYGEDVTSLHGVDFFGMDSKLIGFFKDNMLMKYYERFMSQGYNQVPSLATLTPAQLQSLIPAPDDLQRMTAAVKIIRQHVFVFKSMYWAKEPVFETVSGEVMPDFQIKLDPMIERDFELKCVGGGNLAGNFRVSSMIHGNDPATVDFQGISISPPGRYLLEVHCLDTQGKFLRASQPTSVTPAKEEEYLYQEPAGKSKQELESLFDDIEDMLAI